VKRAHRDLKAWQQAMSLVEGIYTLTAAFPPDERFGLTSDIAASQGCRVGAEQHR